MCNFALMKNILFNHCLHVRNMIELSMKENENLFKGFPNGYCNLTSIWLHDYLYFKGYKDIQFRSRDPFTESIEGNHVWLRVGKFNLDITCDQFNSNDNSFPRVTVASDEESSLYLAPFEISNRTGQIMLEYSLRLAYYPNMEKERDIIYKKMNINFQIKLEQ